MGIGDELIEQCVQQDRAAQKQLYHLLLPYLKSVATRYVYSQQILPDCLQDAFVRIFQNLEQYDRSKGEFKSWACRITINTALNLNRKEGRVTSADPNELVMPVAPDVLEQISGEDLLSLLKRMPDSYFEAFSMHVLDGFEHKEIGDMLGISEGLSRKRVSRARAWISKVFDSASGELKKRTLNVLL